MRIELTQGAEDDLLAIYDLRLRQRGADGADGADAMLDTLYAAIASLSEFPLRGSIPPELDAIGIGDWRQIGVWPWRIIYTVQGELLTVAVIADGRRDFTSLLERRLLQRS